MLISLLEFLACAAVIFYSGTLLSKYGDVIAEKTGLGRAWIGLVLMATITSLPELINGISSVTMANVPDIALGDIMGSCIFNISIIALMDLLHGRTGSILSRADHGHILSAGFGIILIAIASLFILAGEAVPSVWGVGLYTPIIIVVYFIGIRSVYFFEKKRIAKSATKDMKEKNYSDITLKTAAWKYSVNAVVIIIAAALLPFIGDKLAAETGLGKSFIGTFFIGLATSLPEIAVSIGALRLGATDMVLGNIFGSNMFNILILAIDDVFYAKGILLNDVSVNHAAMGFIAVIMTGISVVALIYRAEGKAFLRLGWDAMAIITAYAASVALLYSLRGAG